MNSNSNKYRDEKEALCMGDWGTHGKSKGRLSAEQDI